MRPGTTRMQERVPGPIRRIRDIRETGDGDSGDADGAVFPSAGMGVHSGAQ